MPAGPRRQAARRGELLPALRVREAGRGRSRRGGLPGPGGDRAARLGAGAPGCHPGAAREALRLQRRRPRAVGREAAPRREGAGHGRRPGDRARPAPLRGPPRSRARARGQARSGAQARDARGRPPRLARPRPGSGPGRGHPRGPRQGRSRQRRGLREQRAGLPDQAGGARRGVRDRAQAVRAPGLRDHPFGLLLSGPAVRAHPDSHPGDRARSGAKPGGPGGPRAAGEGTEDPVRLLRDPRQLEAGRDPGAGDRGHDAGPESGRGAHQGGRGGRQGLPERHGREPPEPPHSGSSAGELLSSSSSG